MKTSIALVAGLAFAPLAQTETVVFSMDAVTSCEETTEVNPVCNQVSEYRVYQVSGSSYSQVASDATPSVTTNIDLNGVELCFVGTAFNGLESGYSNTACISPGGNTAPRSPGNFTITVLP